MWLKFCRTLSHIIQGLLLCSRPITSPINFFWVLHSVELMLSKAAKFWLSKSIFYGKSYLNLSIFFSLNNINLGAHILLLTFLIKWMSNFFIFKMMTYFWQLAINSKLNFLSVYWFLCKNIFFSWSVCPINQEGKGCTGAIMENMHTVGVSRTTCLLHLVNAVCEYPLKREKKA